MDGWQFPDGHPFDMRGQITSGSAPEGGASDSATVSSGQGPSDPILLRHVSRSDHSHSLNPSGITSGYGQWIPAVGGRPDALAAHASHHACCGPDGCHTSACPSASIASRSYRQSSAADDPAGMPVPPFSSPDLQSHFWSNEQSDQFAIGEASGLGLLLDSEAQPQPDLRTQPHNIARSGLGQVILATQGPPSLLEGRVDGWGAASTANHMHPFSRHPLDDSLLAHLITNESFSASFDDIFVSLREMAVRFGLEAEQLLRLLAQDPPHIPRNPTSAERQLHQLWRRLAQLWQQIDLWHFRISGMHIPGLVEIANDVYKHRMGNPLSGAVVQPPQQRTVPASQPVPTGQARPERGLAAHLAELEKKPCQSHNKGASSKPGPFRCLHLGCGASFEGRQSWLRHMHAVDPECVWFCEEHSIYLHRKDHAKAHLKGRHGGETNIERYCRVIRAPQKVRFCPNPGCSESFTSWSEYYKDHVPRCMGLSSGRRAPSRAASSSRSDDEDGGNGYKGGDNDDRHGQPTREHATALQGTASGGGHAPQPGGGDDNGHRNVAALFTDSQKLSWQDVAFIGVGAQFSGMSIPWRRGAMSGNWSRAAPLTRSLLFHGLPWNEIGRLDPPSPPQDEPDSDLESSLYSDLPDLTTSARPTPSASISSFELLLAAPREAIGQSPMYHCGESPLLPPAAMASFAPCPQSDHCAPRSRYRRSTDTLERLFLRRPWSWLLPSAWSHRASFASTSGTESAQGTTHFPDVDPPYACESLQPVLPSNRKHGKHRSVTWLSGLRKTVGLLRRHRQSRQASEELSPSF